MLVRRGRRTSAGRSLPARARESPTRNTWNGPRRRRRLRAAPPGRRRRSCPRGARPRRRRGFCWATFERLRTVPARFAGGRFAEVRALDFDLRFARPARRRALRPTMALTLAGCAGRRGSGRPPTSPSRARGSEEIDVSAASRPGALFWKSVCPLRVLDRDRDRHRAQRVRGGVAHGHRRRGAFGAAHARWRSAP